MEKIVRTLEANGYGSSGARPMRDERIHVLRDILLELHHGASLNRFRNALMRLLQGVSAIEISLLWSMN